MLPLLTAILTASLLGSTHCAGMCGAFLAFAVGSGELTGPKKLPSKLALNLSYNLGRLITYITLGAIAGSIGAAVDLGGSMIGIQRTAAALAGAVMVGFGIVAVLRHLGVRVPRMPLPAFLTRLAKKGHEKAFDLSPIARAGTVGLLTTLLPCGWLYAFVITSAGTGSPIWGALAMAAFWLGTLPIMAALGLGVQSLAGPLRKHVPLATSILLVIVGLWTLGGRLAMPALASNIHQPTNIQQALDSVNNAEEACPLCTHK